MSEEVARIECESFEYGGRKMEEVGRGRFIFCKPDGVTSGLQSRGGAVRERMTKVLRVCVCAAVTRGEGIFPSGREPVRGRYR